MATVASLPVAPVSKIDATKVTVAAALQNASGAPNPANYPVQAEKRYYLTFEKGGAELGRSYVFGVDEDGGHVFSSYVYPSSGSWTVRLKDSLDDSSVATVAVTVS
jgi:hypothetical protein